MKGMSNSFFLISLPVKLDLPLTLVQVLFLLLLSNVVLTEGVTTIDFAVN